MLRWLVALLLPGCYLGQAAAGQLDLWRREVPIERAMARHPDPEVRRLLYEARPILAFGRAKGLRPVGYRRFVELEREAVVYVVTACAPLAFEPVVFEFPIVGSFTYLGWFDRGDAEAHGRSLEAAGYDVYVRGASAYSTLGYFEDPLISTMLASGPPAFGELANLLLHESVHATVYVPGQSTFSESLADFVGDELASEYLVARFGAGSPERREYEAAQVRYAARAARLRAALEALEGVYRGAASPDEKRAAKSAILGRLGEDLGLRVPPNNASLLQYRTYGSGRAAIGRLFERCGRDFGRFLGAVRGVDGAAFQGPQAERFDAVIDGLACP